VAVRCVNRSTLFVSGGPLVQIRPGAPLTSRGWGFYSQAQGPVLAPPGISSNHPISAQVCLAWAFVAPPCSPTVVSGRAGSSITRSPASSLITGRRSGRAGTAVPDPGPSRQVRRDRAGRAGGQVQGVRPAPSDIIPKAIHGKITAEKLQRSLDDLSVLLRPGGMPASELGENFPVPVGVQVTHRKLLMNSPKDMTRGWILTIWIISHEQMGVPKTCVKKLPRMRT